MSNALKYFVEKEGCLPLRGTLPDMTTETKHYVNLQQMLVVLKEKRHFLII